MDNFKFNFLSRGQLESGSLEKFFSINWIQNNNVPRGFSVNLIFSIITRMLCGNHLNIPGLMCMLGRRFVLRKKSYQYYLNLLVSTLTTKLAVIFFSEKQKNL